MKKILSILLLLTFCTVQISWAGDAIIIGSDGQARYENENKNISYKYSYINNRNDINMNKKDNKIKMEKYVKNAPQTIENYTQLLKQYDYNIFDNSSKSNKEFVGLKLLDGDYAIWFKGSPYIAEYHKNKALMGLIKQEIVEKSDNGFTQIFYEYRIPQVENYSNKENMAVYSLEMKMNLKHILIVNFNSKQASQYIYSTDGELLCSQEGKNIYVSESARNMLPNWSEKQEYSKNSVTIYAYDPTPGRSIVKNKKNTITRQVIKASMFPFVAIGGIATFVFLPIYMTNLDSPTVKLLEDAYSFYDNFTQDEKY